MILFVPLLCRTTILSQTPKTSENLSFKFALFKFSLRTCASKFSLLPRLISSLSRLVSLLPKLTAVKGVWAYLPCSDTLPCSNYSCFNFNLLSGRHNSRSKLGFSETPSMESFKLSKRYSFNSGDTKTFSCSWFNAREDTMTQSGIMRVQLSKMTLWYFVDHNQVWENNLFQVSHQYKKNRGSIISSCRIEWNTEKPARNIEIEYIREVK